MNNLISLLIGVLISVMIAINGGLTARYGLYSATLIIHIAGLLLISLLLLVKRSRPSRQTQPWYLYLGGAIGVATTVFNNLSFGRISVSAILALGLLGQSVMGLIVDQYGLMNMPRRPFHKGKLWGLLLTLLGIGVMMNGFDALATAVSFLAGVSLVISRTLNARLAENTSVRISTFYNYLIGLLVAIPVCALLGRSEPLLTAFSLSSNAFLYLGGMIGVCVILLSSLTVPRISALTFSLMSFLGQVFTGIFIDCLLSQSFSPRNLVGGMLVTAGMCVNLLVGRKQENASRKCRVIVSSGTQS